jgi:hypothetical protein
MIQLTEDKATAIRTATSQSAGKLSRIFNNLVITREKRQNLYSHNSAKIATTIRPVTHQIQAAIFKKRIPLM